MLRCTPRRLHPPQLRVSHSTQNVEQHLQRLGAVHVEGCGAYEDHHMFSLEEITAAVRWASRHLTPARGPAPPNNGSLAGIASLVPRMRRCIRCGLLRRGQAERGPAVCCASVSRSDGQAGRPAGRSCSHHELGWGHPILHHPAPHDPPYPAPPSAPTPHPPPWSCRRAEDLQRSGQFRHVCLLMTEKDYARQTDLFDAVFRWAGGPAGGVRPYRSGPTPARQERA